MQLAGRFLRGELQPDEIRPKPDQGGMGISHPRPSAMAKACGTAHFTADFRLQGALELAVLRSPLPHARIVAIDSSAAAAMPGVAGVLTAADIKGTNILKYLVAGPSGPLRATRSAISAIRSWRWRPRPAPRPRRPWPRSRSTSNRCRSSTARRRPLPRAPPQLHDDIANLCYSQPQIKGDAKAALAGSAAVIEAKFKTQINHQAPLEPEATIAYWEKGEEAEDEPTSWSSSAAASISTSTWACSRRLSAGRT